jgi:hypothetical protein
MKTSRTVVYRACSLGLVLSLGALLSACSGPSGQNGGQGGIQSIGQGISQRTDALASRLRGAGAQTSDASQSSISSASVASNLRRDCPIAELREGTQTDRVYQEGREGDPTGVVYQGTINRVARECIYGSDGSVSVRFGITGRVVLGPVGVPGPQTVSVRAVLLNTDTGAVWSELFPVTVDLGIGRANQAFSLIQQTPATVIPPSETSKHRVIIGFDSQQTQLQQ